MKASYEMQSVDLTNPESLIFSCKGSGPTHEERKLTIRNLPSRETTADIKRMLDLRDKRRDKINGIAISFMILAVAVFSFALGRIFTNDSYSDVEIGTKVTNSATWTCLFCEITLLLKGFLSKSALRHVLNRNDHAGSIRTRYLGGFDLTSEDGITNAERHLYNLHESVTRIHKMLELERKGMLKRIEMETSCSAYSNVTIKYGYADDKGDISREVIGLTFEITENVIMEPDTVVMDFRDMTFRYSYDNTHKEETK